MPRIEYDVEYAGGPLEGLVLRLHAVDEKMADRVRALLRRAGVATTEFIQDNIPIGPAQGAGHVHMADTVRTSGIMYRPGGAGGGGFYELSITVGREGQTPQVGWTLEGTGIYNGGDRITAGRGNLGNMQAMPMQPAGTSDTIFRTSARGQKPQDEWLVGAHQVARTTISHGVSNMGRDL